MGAAGSHFAASGHENLLARFGASESIAVGDTFWRDLLTFPQQLTRFDPALLQQELAPTCHSLGALSSSYAACDCTGLLCALRDQAEVACCAFTREIPAPCLRCS